MWNTKLKPNAKFAVRITFFLWTEPSASLEVIIQMRLVRSILTMNAEDANKVIFSTRIIILEDLERILIGLERSS